MKIEIKDNTEEKHMIVTHIPDRLYISPNVWVSTSYGEVKVGIDNGSIYTVDGGQLVEIFRQAAE